jgi:glyoxylase-like metal-dependent hydrolase (beta-lactamase superfamily II)
MNEVPHIDRRDFGGLALTVVDTGVTEWRASYNVPRSMWVGEVPAIDADGWLPLHTNALHIQTPQASIVIDPCLWHQAHLRLWPNVRLKESYPGVEIALGAIGSSPADITHVLMTHSHFDHCSGLATLSPGGWELTYPNAIHLLNRLDYPAARTGSGVVFEILHSVEERGRLKLVSGEYLVSDGVTLLPAPGETPGHMVVDVKSAGKRLIYAGDLFHFPFELEHLDWIPEGRNLDKTIASRTSVIDLVEATGASMMFTHADFPGWGTCRWTNRPHARWVAE